MTPFDRLDAAADSGDLASFLEWLQTAGASVALRAKVPASAQVEYATTPQASLLWWAVWRRQVEAVEALLAAAPATAWQDLPQAMATAEVLARQDDINAHPVRVGRRGAAFLTFPPPRGLSVEAAATASARILSHLRLAFIRSAASEVEAIARHARASSS